MPQTLKQNLYDALAVAVPAAAPPGGDAAPPTEAALFAELALWSATSDGALDADEVEALAELLRGLPGLPDFDVAAANRMVDTMAERYTTEDAIAARIAELAVAIRTPPLRRASYQLALWSAARDGRFSEEETDFLEALQDCLGITDDEAQELLHATIEVDPSDAA